MNHSSLQQKLNSLKGVDPRNAAEYAYALAMISKHKGNNDQAVQFGNEAIALFDRCDMDTMENCASRNTTIEGVVIPDIIHQDVVRDHLRPLVLQG